jgi:fimbrial chaperone protein
MERKGTSPPTDLSAVTARLHDGKLEIADGSPSRVKVSQVVWVNPDGARIEVAPGLLGYALAGQRMQWPMELPAKAKPGGSLRAHFNSDPDEQALALDRTDH